MSSDSASTSARLSSIAIFTTEPPRLSVVAGPGVVDEDPTHDVGGGAEEVGAVLPLHSALIDQLQVGLVHEGGGRERVIGSFLAQERPREPAQIIVDDRRELVERGVIAALQRSSRSVTSGRSLVTSEV